MACSESAFPERQTEMPSARSRHPKVQIRTAIYITLTLKRRRLTANQSGIFVTKYTPTIHGINLFRI